MSGVFRVMPFLFRGKWGVVKGIEFRASCVPGKSSVMEIQLQPPPPFDSMDKAHLRSILFFSNGSDLLFDG